MLNSRDIAVFKRGLVQTVGCAIAGAAFRLTYSYLQARLTWKWRKKLTDLFHSKYFSGFNYYSHSARNAYTFLSSKSTWHPRSTGQILGRKSST